jgi:hypothetical protein
MTSVTSLLLSVQIPVVDFRPLLAQDTGRHEQPAFPQPDRVFSRGSSQHHRSSFVAGVGPVRPRLKGGAGPWVSESYYIDVSSLVRLRITKLPADSEARYFRIKRLPRPVYRNFHTDGIVGRVEIGFDYDDYLLGPGRNPGDPDRVPGRAGRRSELGSRRGALLQLAQVQGRPDARLDDLSPGLARR